MHSLPLALRWINQKQIKKQLDMAAASTQLSYDDGHVHRLAYLMLKKQEIVDHDAQEAVQLQFNQSRDPDEQQRAGKQWSKQKLMFGVGVVFLCLGAAAGGFFYVQSKHDAWAMKHKLMGRMSAMGEGEAYDPLFQIHLPNLALYMSRPEMDEAKISGATMQVEADVKARHPKILKETQNFILAVKAYKHLVNTVEAEGKIEDAQHDVLMVATNAFNKALQDHRIPYCIDVFPVATSKQGVVILITTFHVDKKTSFSAGGRPQEVLFITRVDNLNVANPAIGYTRATGKYALVLQDEIERYMLNHLVRAWRTAGDLFLVENTPADFPMRQTLEAAIRSDLKKEWAHIPGLQAFGQAIDRRTKGIEAANAWLMQKQSMAALPEPDGYIYHLNEDALKQHLPSHLRWAVLDAQKDLESEKNLRVYASIEKAIAQSIAHHEAQHRFDYDQDLAVHIPEALKKYVGETVDETHVNAFAENTNRELSAYMSQLAHADGTVFYQLNFLLGNMFARGGANAERTVALVIFEELANGFGIAHEPLVLHRRIQKDIVASLYFEMRKQSPDAISAMARKRWEVLYGRPLGVMRSGSKP